MQQGMRVQCGNCKTTEEFIVHYYMFNIGDYASHTQRLSVPEDCAYRRLLDLYYLNERPFNGCSTDVAREIGMSDSLDSVEYILQKFFPNDGECWRNKRADKEIARYQSKKKLASKAGKASGKARRGAASEQTLNGRSSNVEPTINQEPLTINQEPVKTTVRFAAPTVEEVRNYCVEKGYTMDPERFVNFYESKNWMVGKNKMQKWKAACANWEKRNSADEKSNGQRQPVNQRRLSPHERVRANAERAAAGKRGPAVAPVGGDGGHLV